MTPTTTSPRAGLGRPFEDEPDRIGFSGSEVADITDASYRQIDYWCRTGVLGRRELQDVGSGGRRRFTRTDIEVVHAIAQLSPLGATGEWLRSAAAAVRARPVDPAGEWLIVLLAGSTQRVSRSLPETIEGPGWVVPLVSHGADHTHGRAD